MKKIVLGVLALAAFGLHARETINIGVIFPLSGEAEVVGTQFQDGVLMRQREQNGHASLFDYKIIMEDSQELPRLENFAYLKLISVDNCDVILNDDGNLLAPLAARDKKLFLSFSWDERAAADKLAFIHCTPVKPQAQMMAGILHSLGIKRVAILCEIQKGAMAMCDAQSSDINALGIEARTIRFPLEERDFRGYLLRFYDFNPDAYIVQTFEPDFQIIIHRIRELNKTVPITCIEGYTYLDDLSPYKGSFFIAGNQATDDFTRRFVRETGKTKVGFAGNAYDALDLIIHAYETAGAKLHRKPTTAEAADVLRNLKDYPGAIGSLTMGPNRVIQSPAVLKYIENGKAVPVTIEELKKKLGK